MTVIPTNTPNQKFLDLTAKFPIDSHALGSDVSKWQGEINFELMRKRGIRYIAIRTSVGNYYLDPMRSVYYQNALANDIYPTDYHVIRPDNSVVSQMDKYFLNRPSGDTPPIWPMVLDDEIHGKSITVWKNKNKKKYKIVYKKFPPSQITDILLGCKEKVEERDGVTPIHYANLFFLFDFLEDVSDIWKMDLWIAQYGTLNPGRLNERFQPMLDALNNGQGIEHLIYFWQGLADSDDQGPYFGSGSHGLDIDFYMKGGIDDFISRYITAEEPPPPPPPDCSGVRNDTIDEVKAKFNKTLEDMKDG